MISSGDKWIYVKMLNLQYSDDICTDGERQCSISAHSYVLASRSPVFFAMLMGPAKEQSDTIQISDTDKDSFTEMLR